MSQKRRTRVYRKPIRSEYVMVVEVVNPTAQYFAETLLCKQGLRRGRMSNGHEVCVGLTTEPVEPKEYRDPIDNALLMCVYGYATTDPRAKLFLQ